MAPVRKESNVTCNTLLAAPWVCRDRCNLLEGLHTVFTNVQVVLSDVDALFIGWAFPFNAALQPAEDGGQSDYNPNFGLSREIMYRKVKAQQESKVSFKHRLILIWNGHALQIPAAAREKGDYNHACSSCLFVKHRMVKMHWFNLVLDHTLLHLHRSIFIISIPWLSVVFSCQCRRPRNLNWIPFSTISTIRSRALLLKNYIRMATSLQPTSRPEREFNNVGRWGFPYYCICSHLNISFFYFYFFY